MTACSAIGCTNRNDSKQGKTNVTFHRFPKDAVQRMKWKLALRRRNFEPSRRAVVCSQHFSEDQLDRTSLFKVRLLEGAVPKIFKTFPSYVQKRKRPGLRQRKELCKPSDIVLDACKTSSIPENACKGSVSRCHSSVSTTLSDQLANVDDIKTTTPNIVIIRVKSETSEHLEGLNACEASDISEDACKASNIPENACEKNAISGDHESMLSTTLSGELADLDAVTAETAPSLDIGVRSETSQHLGGINTCETSDISEDACEGSIVSGAYASVVPTTLTGELANVGEIKAEPAPSFVTGVRSETSHHLGLSVCEGSDISEDACKANNNIHENTFEGSVVSGAHASVLPNTLSDELANVGALTAEPAPSFVTGVTPVTLPFVNTSCQTTLSFVVPSIIPNPIVMPSIIPNPVVMPSIIPNPVVMSSIIPNPVVMPSIVTHPVNLSFPTSVALPSTVEDAPTKYELKRRLDGAEKKNHMYRKKVRLLQQQNRRQKKRIKSLISRCSNLKQQVHELRKCLDYGYDYILPNGDDDTNAQCVEKLSDIENSDTDMKTEVGSDVESE